MRHEVLGIDVYTESGRWSKNPDAVAFEVVVVAGQGGTSSNGHPGSPGEALRDVFLADELPDTVPVFVGKGARSQFGSPGDSGYVLIVAYGGRSGNDD